MLTTDSTEEILIYSVDTVSNGSKTLMACSTAQEDSLSSARRQLACSSTRQRRVRRLRGRRRTSLTILELADHALLKMVRFVLLRPLRSELDGQDVDVETRIR
jgi:hypothetical protein